MKNILEMTHEELMNADVQTRELYRITKKQNFYCIVKNYFDEGYKHVQIGFDSCIKLMYNNNGFYFVTRNGKGFGCNTGEYINLKDATDKLCDYGHYSIEYTKISAK